LIALLPFIVGMPALGVLCLRRGANLIGWDEHHIHLESPRGRESVSWGDIDWFRNLWLTHKLEGGGKAWIAMLVKYRTPRWSITVLMTVSGSALEVGFFEPLSPGKYKTVFDVRIPSKNRAVSN
jgi:hypothetical protein